MIVFVEQVVNAGMSVWCYWLAAAGFYLPRAAVGRHHHRPFRAAARQRPSRGRCCLLDVDAAPHILCCISFVMLYLSLRYIFVYAASHIMLSIFLPSGLCSAGAGSPGSSRVRLPHADTASESVVVSPPSPELAACRPVDLPDFDSTRHPPPKT